MKAAAIVPYGQRDYTGVRATEVLAQLLPNFGTNFVLIFMYLIFHNFFEIIGGDFV